MSKGANVQIHFGGKINGYERRMPHAGDGHFAKKEAAISACNTRASRRNSSKMRVSMTTTILHGDCREILKTLPAESAHCVVTSPPYFGLRDYGVDGQIGLEQTPQAFVVEMVAVFREVRRVLRNDGTLWLNMGDSYASGGRGGNPTEETSTLQGSHKSQKASMVKRGKAHSGFPKNRTLANNAISMGGYVGPGVKPKDLMGMPWRVAFALQADGWYLRQDIIWSKPNPMPESVTDRCTKAHEYVFLLSKSPRYYFDQSAIKEPCSQDEMANGFRGGSYTNNSTFNNAQGGKRKNRGNYKMPDGWATHAGAHGNFHKDGREKGKRSGNKARKPGNARGCPEGAGQNVCGSVPWEGTRRNKRSVWEIASEPFKEAHFATFPPALIEPCILAGCPKDGTVLDPFFGAGTTGLVADRLQRACIGIELNSEYIDIAQRRIRGDAGMFSNIRVEQPEAI